MKYCLVLITVLLCLSAPVFATGERKNVANDDVTLSQLYREFKVFEARTDERFTAVEKRFDQVDKRFSDMYSVLTIIAGSFTALTVAMLGIIFWDRKTIIEKSVEKSVAKTKEFAADREAHDRLMAALRELAQSDTQLADTLRRFNLL
jgi:hypothetical protein